MLNAEGEQLRKATEFNWLINMLSTYTSPPTADGNDGEIAGSGPMSGSQDGTFCPQAKQGGGFISHVK